MLSWRTYSDAKNNVPRVMLKLAPRVQFVPCHKYGVDFNKK